MSDKVTAADLRNVFRGPIVEADEWRPLADYVEARVQASRAAALEEAAKIADDASPDFEHDDEDRGRGWMASHLADHYRTLAQGGGK